ncbi:ferritin-like domain-containing protein [Peteryoungia desertarenae]|uniref:Ferritin-like domain-containing protein n=1 Tax=Peteryoungia desertarenae TaxID=1813451 RepID=A0ABX6QK59_9HYPH|nr:ferritin-like domain-containing protein [Peteryoungia desertarenae]QLF68948.1 ferritin-like domain-containing protein [Peteryoungia desertarenae]
MADLRDHYIDWIRDAHAMEEQAVTMLTGQAKRLEHYPELKARIEQHIRETENQSKQLERVLDSLGDDSSTLKDLAGKTTASMQAMGGMFASDEVIKGSMAGYTFENMEMATYKVLIAAAEALGDASNKSIFEAILEEEKAMAAWLWDHLDDTTRQYLARNEADVTAKR